MRQAYPICVSKDANGMMLVRVPDWDQYTEGRDMADAIFMARDLIGILGVCYKEDGMVIPEPGSVSFSVESNEILTYVDIDIDDYKAKHENRLVKKNCTIPYYLEQAAEAANLNFSRVLSEALSEKLHLSID